LNAASALGYGKGFNNFGVIILQAVFGDIAESCNCRGQNNRQFGKVYNSLPISSLTYEQQIDLY
jgi:hypothetical protein